MANFFTNSVNKIFKEKSLTEKYECLNEAKSFIDGFKKNPLSEIKRTKEKLSGRSVSAGSIKKYYSDTSVVSQQKCLCVI